MTDLRHIPTSQIREAALAWHRHDRMRAGFFYRPNMDLHARIGDLIGEIERLRQVEEILATYDPLSFKTEPDGQYRASWQDHYHAVAPSRDEAVRRLGSSLRMAHFDVWQEAQARLTAYFRSRNRERTTHGET